LIAHFAELALWLTLVALLVFGLAYAFRPAEGVGRHLKETVLAFVAFYFLLLGLRMMVGPIGPDGPLLGDFFASLALTFFWATRRGQP
jgi:hypothetical protein